MRYSQYFYIGLSASMKITTNLNMFFIYELPIPPINFEDGSFDKLIKNVTKLVSVSKEFDDLKDEIGVEKIPTDNMERIKLIVEIENIAKELYGLDSEEIAHILDSFHQKTQK